MKRIGLYLGLLMIGGILGTHEAWAMHEKDSKERIEDLSSRIEQLEQTKSHGAVGV
jgi:hypothetical protein